MTPVVTLFIRSERSLLLASLAVSVALHGALYLLIDDLLFREPINTVATLPHKLYITLVRSVPTGNEGYLSHENDLSPVAPQDSQSSTQSTADSPNVTRPPELISGGPSDFEFPSEMAVNGEMVIRLTIDRNGKPVQVKLLRSTLPRQIEGMIIRQFLEATYRPGLVNGIPTRDHIDMAIQTGEQGVAPGLSQEQSSR